MKLEWRVQAFRDPKSTENVVVLSVGVGNGYETRISLAPNVACQLADNLKEAAMLVEQDVVIPEGRIIVPGGSS